MVWVAIPNRGISKPLFRQSKSEAVDSHIYINECLEKRLLSFIPEHHTDSYFYIIYIFVLYFWPDLAGCHYSKQTIALMDENVNFVPKEINPPNVLHAHLIENFWGCLAQKVYERGWEAYMKQQLIN